MSRTNPSPEYNAGRQRSGSSSTGRPSQSASHGEITQDVSNANQRSIYDSPQRDAIATQGSSNAQARFASDFSRNPSPLATALLSRRGLPEPRRNETINRPASVQGYASSIIPRLMMTPTANIQGSTHSPISNTSDVYHSARRAIATSGQRETPRTGSAGASFPATKEIRSGLTPDKIRTMQNFCLL